MLLPDFSTLGAVAALVETVEAVGQVGSKLQVNFIPPTFGQHWVRPQGELVELRVLQNLEGPHAFRCQEQHVGHLHLLGVENNGVGVFPHVQLDASHAGEVEGGQVGVDGQVVVEGEDGFGESHAVPWEWLAIGGYGDTLGLALVWQLRPWWGRKGDEEQKQERSHKHGDNEGGKSCHL